MPSNRIKCILLCFCISVVLIRFVKLLDGYAEKLKERKELTDEYVKIVQELMHDITFKTSVGRRISYYNGKLQKNLDELNSVLCDALGIKKKQLTKKRFQQTHLWKIHHTQRFLFDKLYTLPEEPKEAAGRYLSIFLFLDRCFDEKSCHYISQLFNKYYHHLHHENCMDHGIAPTLVLNSAVLCHAAHLNWLLVDTFGKFLKEEKTFIRLLLPQFFFYVVIIILEKIGLYPVVEKCPWELSDEEKKLPPSNYNSLRFLIFCIEKQKDSFCSLAMNQIFLSKLRLYGKYLPFPTSIEEFAKDAISDRIETWFLKISQHNDNFKNFIGHLLGGVSVIGASEATISTNEGEDLFFNSDISTVQKKKKRTNSLIQQYEESDNQKKRAKSSIPANSTSLKSDHDTKQRFELKAIGQKSKIPCERCQGENKEKDAEACVIDKQNNKETYFCKFHATDWYATHELLAGCEISIDTAKRCLTYRHYNYRNDLHISNKVKKKMMDMDKKCDDLATKVCAENIGMEVECPVDCERGNECDNHKIRKLREKNTPQENPRFTIKLCDKKEKGYGLFSNVGFNEMDVILEYVGEVFYTAAKDYIKKRKNEDVRRLYYATLAPNFEVVSDTYGNESRFINHSCKPNAEMMRWKVSLPLLFDMVTFFLIGASYS